MSSHLGMGNDETNDPFKWNGYWWVPGSTVRLPGVLTIEGRNGPTLEVLGSFHGKNDKHREGVVLVHGTTGGAEYVTLQNLSEGGAHYDVRGQYRTVYDVELVVTGEHFQDMPLFEELQVEFSTLVQWVNEPLINEQELRWAESGLRIKTCAPIQESIYDCTQYRLGLCYFAGYRATAGRYLSLYPCANMVMRWVTARAWADTVALIRSLQDFLTFATGVRTDITSVRSRPVRCTERGHAHEMNLYSRCFRSTGSRPEPRTCLFTLKDVAANLGGVLSRWFDIGDSLQPVIELHLSSTYNPHMQVEGQFLSAIQAVEAFHRRMRDNRELPETDHAVRMTDVLRSCPENLRHWVKAKLSYSNEPGLKKRLKSLWDEFGGILRCFNLNRDEFCKAVYIARNYLTHYDQRLERRAAKGTDLWQLVRGIQLLADICLLDACGVDSLTIARVCAKRHMLLARPLESTNQQSASDHLSITDAHRLEVDGPDEAPTV